MKRIPYLILLASCLILLTSCGGERKKQFDPRKVDFSAEVAPIFGGQLYPSLILSTTQSETTDHTPKSTDLRPLTCTLTSPANNAVLRIVVDSSSLNYVTILQEILPAKGEKYTFTPSIKWKYEQLRGVRQRRPLDLSVTCFINDEEVDIRNIHVEVRSVNECPLSLRDADGTVVDTRFLFAAYVNEEHPSIPDILTEILEEGIVTRFAGYQSTKKEAVKEQVFSVWYYALNHGITYSSISCTPNPNPRANVQHIRFFDEVLNTRQANCIDACVFLASILRKIGLKPVIFVEPCHAYLGYYTDKKKKTIATLETTITSWVNFPELRKSLDAEGRLPQQQLEKIAKYLSEKQVEDYRQGRIDTETLLKAVAGSLFDKASQYNQENYQANRQHFDDPTAITYQQLDIETLRQSVQPIN